MARTSRPCLRLLSGSPAARATADEDAPDKLRPAIGIVAAVLWSVPVWLLLALLVWFLA